MIEHGGSRKGVGAALASALFLGLAPIFGKQAIVSGFSPLAVVALRTAFAAGLLLVLVAIFRPTYLYIYPAGLAGCALAGMINGIGSILYYLALGKLPASVGQLLYSSYPLFLVGWLILNRQPPTRLTILRVLIAIGGVFMLTCPGLVKIEWTGVLLMLGAAALYALHLPINQRVLYDIPAPTVTLYTLLAMSVIVLPSFFLFGFQPLKLDAAWWPLFGLTMVTFLSRLTLFLGVKHLGGMQTALLGLSELFVTLILGHIWLHESLTVIQWLGALFLGTSLILIGFEKIVPNKYHKSGRWLNWLRPPEVPPRIPWGPHE